PLIGWLSARSLGGAGPGLVAGTLCTANFILALLILPESWTPAAEHVPSRARLAQWKHTIQRPLVGTLIVIFFLATFCFTCFELTLGLIISRNFGLDLQNESELRIAQAIAGKLFMYCGIVGAVVQAGPIGRLVKSYGEQKLIVASLI